MNQPKGSKKKLTLIATEEGVERAKKALIRLGKESQKQFAESILMSRSTISKFFNRKPIQLDSFKRICEQLGGLKWQEIAGISETKQREIIREKDSKSYSEKEIGLGSATLTKITVTNPQTNTKKVVITLQGDIESVTNIKILQLILRDYSGNTIEIQDIQPGSIKISLEGSQEDIDNLITAIKSKELTQLDSFLIEDIVEVDEEAETAETNDKWQLVQKIRAQKVKKPDFREIDLSDADLSGADLSGADLTGADLTGADLTGVNLKGITIDKHTKLDFKWHKVWKISNPSVMDQNLKNADLKNADLRGAYLRGAYLRDANLKNANLTGANLSGANLTGAYLRGAYLRGAFLNNAYLSGANLSGAFLNNAYLSGANLKNANLKNANLTGANLILANLTGADLTGADLTGADLTGANVYNARFDYNSGISKSLEQNLTKRGADFENSEDRSDVLMPS